MSKRHPIPVLLLAFALCAPLGGCAVWGRYRHLPAGQDGQLWRPEDIAAYDFDAQVANPADLQHGTGTSQTDARTAGDAVDRMRRGRVTPLPESSISHVGVSAGGGAAPSAGGQ